MNDTGYAGGGKGKTCLLGCGCLAALAILAGLSLLYSFKGSYNNLVKQDQEVRAAWAQVENNLQRRSDLIPNLVATVKGFTKHEEKVFGDIADARARIGSAGAGPSDAKIKASNDMSGALSRLLVIEENYPDLKSDKSFQGLQFEVTGTENRLAHSREEYNRAVQSYNETAKSFPLTLFVKSMGFKTEQPYFEAPKESKARPNIDFSK
jgi:LemA protein